MEKKAAGKAKEYLILLSIIIGVYIGFKYLSPLFAPFLFAFAAITVLYPVLEKMQKKIHVKKSFLAAGILILLFVTLGTALWFLFVFLFQEISGILKQAAIFEEKFCMFISGCCDGLENRFGFDGDGIETFIMDRVNIFIENFQVQIVPQIMNQSIGYVKNIVSVIGFFVVIIIASVLLAKDYGAIMDKVRSSEELENVYEIGCKIIHHVGTFIKAQITILLIISVLCMIGLLLGGIEGGFFIGLLTGFMDMLPFIGTGLVLMPLAFWQILNGYYAKAAVCVVLYVICVLTREFLEPKLIGEKMGIFPVAILLSVYAGVKLFGVFGILKGPLALITIYEIYHHIKKKKDNVKETVQD